MSFVATIKKIGNFSLVTRVFGHSQVQAAVTKQSLTLLEARLVSHTLVDMLLGINQVLQA